jgi:hypothetical protein
LIGIDFNSNSELQITIRKKNFAYVNNIQITWKTIHLSVFYRTNSPFIDQSRAEGNNTECVGKKRFNDHMTGEANSMVSVCITLCL